ncbi:hypothetical protein [Streptomyces rubiginosohelvolus]|uniref:hypothetical protein n=1 Tax=Streptomyces rubiginosohelvolus TaxID=67362 RepID=UPI0035D57203
MTDTTLTPADRPADQLRAAAQKLRAARFSGAITATPTVAALIGARLPLAAWLEAEAAPPITAQHSDRCTDPQCTTLAALAVARQLLGTTSCGCPHPVDEHSVYGCAEDCACEWMPPKTGAVCPSPETHNWGCGCPTDQAPAAKRVEAEHVLYDALTKGTPLAQVRQHIIDQYRAAVIAEHTHAAPPAPADRAAVLREVADEIAGIDFHPNAHARSIDIAAGLAHRLRALAADAAAGVQPPTTSEAELTERVKHSGPTTEFCVLCLSGEHERAAEAHPPRIQWRTETHDPIANEWDQGTPYTERADAVARHQTREERFPTWKDGSRVQRRLVRATTTYTVEPEPAAPAAPEETQ